MADCRHLIDISPYPALCEHPFFLYGGAPTTARCDGCGWFEPRRDNEADEDYPRTATRKVVSYGDYGRCLCSACDWSIDPDDAFCRHCGAELTATEYVREEQP